MCKKMTFTEARKILELHNLWRRDNHVPNKYEMINPTELGIAIEIAIEVLTACIGSGCESYSDVTDLYHELNHIKREYEIDD